MKTHFSPQRGMAPLLPALAFFFCFHLPTTGAAQSCNSIPVASSLFKTSASFFPSSTSDKVVLSTFFSGKWSPSCGAEACNFVYRLKATLPATAEVTVLSDQGWLTAKASSPTVVIDPTRDAIQVAFDAQLAQAKAGPAIVVQIKVEKGSGGGVDIFNSLDGIVQVDIIAPARWASEPVYSTPSPYPNPASSQLHWENTFPEASDCRLYNLEGRVLAQASAASGARLSFDTHDLPAGVYLLYCKRAGHPPLRYKVRITH